MFPANATLTGSRAAGGSWERGGNGWEWVGETRTPFTTSGSLQPMSARAMENLPEGRQNRQSFVYYSEDVLKTVADPGDPSPQNADILTVMGEAFEVLSVAPWVDDILSHNVYVLQKSHPVEAGI